MKKKVVKELSTTSFTLLMVGNMATVIGIGSIVINLFTRNNLMKPLMALVSGELLMAIAIELGINN